MSSTEETTLLTLEITLTSGVTIDAEGTNGDLDTLVTQAMNQQNIPVPLRVIRHGGVDHSAVEQQVMIFPAHVTHVCHDPNAYRASRGVP